MGERQCRPLCRRKPPRGDGSSPEAKPGLSAGFMPPGLSLSLYCFYPSLGTCNMPRIHQQTLKTQGWVPSPKTAPLQTQLWGGPLGHLHFWPTGYEFWGFRDPSSGWVIGQKQSSGKRHAAVLC